MIGDDDASGAAPPVEGSDAGGTASAEARLAAARAEAAAAPEAPPPPRALRFGLPSKGRLKTQMTEFLAKAGLKLVTAQDDREYAGALIGVENVEIVFLQASEIPSKLARGDIHVGVTGEDLIRDRVLGWETRIALLKPLGFGHATVVVAAPKCWIDVATLDDLDDVAAEFRRRHGHSLRIATKYTALARQFFRERGVANYQLIDSQGATEGLVAAGAAEAIVDITSSGETLRANHLKVLDDGRILASQAQLCASLTAHWGNPALQPMRALLDRAGGVVQGARPIWVQARIDRTALARAEPGLERIEAHVRQRPLVGFPGHATLTAPSDRIGHVVDLLTAAGATAIETEIAPDATDPPMRNTLYETFIERLERAGG